jgi:hypothetical protein
MNRDEWDRLSFKKRDKLILDLIYGEHAPLLVTSDRDVCASYVEQWIAHRDLRSEYIKELTKILIGDNVPDSGDLWPLITATPSERCLAALNALETTVPKED